MVTSDALGKLQNAMSGVPFMSPEDNESQSSTDETESDMSGSPTHEDVETTKYAMSELSHIVESLFDLSTVLDEKIQELEDRDRIMETDIHHSTDIRALIVNIGSKFPQAPESLVELVSSNIHINRRRLNRALREPSSEESFLAESTSQPNIKSTPASRFTVFNINRSQTSTVADSHSIRSIGSSMNSTNDLSFCDTPLSTVFTGTSYTTTSFLEIPSIAESLFSSSIASSDGEASANHGIPPKPVADSGGRIKCLICGNRITVSRRGGWR